MSRIASIRPIVIDFLKKNKDISSAGAARILCQMYPHFFKSKEQARSRVREVRGVNISNKGKRYAEEGLVRTKAEIKRCMSGLPKAIEMPYKEFHIIAPKYSKFLILPDIHAPYHENEPLTAALEYAIKEKVKNVILNGDAVDFYQLSRFLKDPRNVDIQFEIDSIGAIIDVIKSALKPRRFIWKFGNHELRFENYLKAVAPMLIQLKKLSVSSLFEFKEKGIEYVAPSNPIKYKALTISHGQEWGGSSAVNPARGVFMRAFDNVVISHFHRTSEHVAKTAQGKMITTWSTGCLCNLRPEYAVNNQWNHGFAVLTIGEKDIWRVDNRRIINMRTVV